VRVKLTPANVLTLAAPPAGADRAEYVDLDCRGLVLRVMPGGRRFYFVRYRANGQPRRYRLGEASTHGGIALDKARRAARGVLGEVARGLDPQAARAAERRTARRRRDEGTVAVLVGRFLRARERDARRPLSANTLRSWRGLLSNRIAKSTLGAMPPADVARRDIRALLEATAEKYPITANRLLELLRVAFTWAVDREELPASPCIGLSKTAERKRERTLSHDELRRILVAIEAEETGRFPVDQVEAFRQRSGGKEPPADLAPHPIEGAAWRLLLLTGLRANEVLCAPRNEVDVKARRWTIPPSRMKGRRAHTVPLSSAAVGVIRGLEEISDSSTPWLLPGPRDPRRPLSTIAHSLERLKALSHTDDWSAHDLRHTLRSELSALGVPFEVKELVLAHALPGLAGTYDHHSYLRERGVALERWARVLDRIRADSEPAKVAEFASQPAGA